LWNALATEIENREIILVVCTDAINASRGAMFEYNLGLSLGKLVIPVRYDGAPIPIPLFASIREEFNDHDYGAKFNGLMTKLPKSYEQHLVNQQVMRSAYGAEDRGIA
jgi:hypothetical protein